MWDAYATGAIRAATDTRAATEGIDANAASPTVEPWTHGEVKAGHRLVFGLSMPFLYCGPNLDVKGKCKAQTLRLASAKMWTQIMSTRTSMSMKTTINVPTTRDSPKPEFQPQRQFLHLNCTLIDITRRLNKIAL
eukprot:365866-Chlamydomonas_euryale.AAC.2